MTSANPGKWLNDNLTKIGMAISLAFLMGITRLLFVLSVDMAVVRTTIDIRLPDMLTAIEKNHRSMEAHQAHHNNDHFSTRAGDE